MSQISLNIEPVSEANHALNILTIRSDVMMNDDRLHRLIDKIELTGAIIRRLFPSADIITVESTNDQFLMLQDLDEVTAANLHRMEQRITAEF